MQSSKGETPDMIIQTLWNAIFAGTRLKHVGPVKTQDICLENYTFGAVKKQKSSTWKRVRFPDFPGQNLSS